MAPGSYVRRPPRYLEVPRNGPWLICTMFATLFEGPQELPLAHMHDVRHVILRSPGMAPGSYVRRPPRYSKVPRKGPWLSCTTFAAVLEGPQEWPLARTYDVYLQVPRIALGAYVRRSPRYLKVTRNGPWLICTTFATLFKGSNEWPLAHMYDVRHVI